MLPNYYGQYIFNAQGQPWALEVLLRAESVAHKKMLLPQQIFERDGMNDQNFYSLDLLVINWIYNHLHLIRQQLPISHIFFNTSDFFLKELCLHSNTQLFQSLAQLQLDNKLTLVMEINEDSLIDHRHLSIIIENLMPHNIQVALDDFKLEKHHRFSAVPFHYIKTLPQDLSSAESLFPEAKIILEHATNEHIQAFCDLCGYQGFELHSPSAFSDLDSNCQLSCPFKQAFPLQQTASIHLTEISYSPQNNLLKR